MSDIKYLYTVLIGLIVLGGLVLLSNLLWGIAAIGAVGLIVYLVYYLIHRPIQNKVINPDLIFKLHDVLSSNIALKTNAILMKYTTNENYSGEINLTPVYKNPEEYMTLLEFKRQINFYCANFNEEIINCGMGDRFADYYNKLFHIGGDRDHIHLMSLHMKMRSIQ